MNNFPVDTIYEYTKNLLAERGEALTRIDTKVSVYIGFSAVLIRLAFNLPHNSFESGLLRVCVCISASLTIILCSLGLLGKPSGNVADPKILMSNEWFFNKSEEEHKAYITNGFIETLDEFDIVFRRRRVLLAWITTCFLIASVFFATAVIFS